MPFQTFLYLCTVYLATTDIMRKMILTPLKQWMLVALLSIGSVTAYAQDVKMTYPQAEWSKAGDILMHTPGQELFCGVIHPSAGLFEDYFDVDKAAEEHRGYISMLIFDISSIPDENPEATEEYRQDVLSKMSRADLIRCILLQPMVKLWRTDNNTGYEATYILNPLMNLYFTRDQSITTPRGHVICNMNSSQRSPETSIIELCYNHLDLKPILHIDGEGRMEGGDYIPAGNISLIGCGMRTNDEGIRQMLEAYRLDGTPATPATRGIVVEDGKLKVVK